MSTMSFTDYLISENCAKKCQIILLVFVTCQILIFLVARLHLIANNIMSSVRHLFRLEFDCATKNSENIC